MSDPDAAPDPIDKAYAKAEAVLSDDDARAARRARVLAGVAREPAPPPAVISPSTRRLAWRRGGWLAAASVAGLGLLFATQIYQPAIRQQQAAPAAAPAATPPRIAASPAPSATAPLPAQAPRAAAGRPETGAPAQMVSRPGTPPVASPLPIAPVPQAFPAAPAPPPPPPAVVTAERAAPAPAADYAERLASGARDERADAQNSARSAAKAAASGVAPPPAAPSRFEASAGLSSDRGARLRAAAAAGRTAETETLLDQGVPVDAPDEDGDTALMKSIQADHLAAAALLRRRGASLDRRNHAGVSARDMATANGNAELNRAIGLGP